MTWFTSWALFMSLVTDWTRHSLRDAIGGLVGPDREAAARYLDGGVLISAVMGFERDVLDGSLATLTRSHLTDGEHIWRHELVYYVRK